jgi:predicted TIM-barrel fold metal-dependent hydrolase
LIIDFHTHIVPPEIIARRDEYLTRDLWFRELYGNRDARLVTSDELVGAMDADGVDQAVTFGFGWQDPDLCQRNNDHVIEAVERYPDRLFGLAVVNAAHTDKAVREIERCAAAGLLGIGELMPDGQGYRLDHQATMAPLVEAVQATGGLILTHCSEPVGHLYPGKGTVTPDEVIRFARLFPDATLVCAHWGGGAIFYELMPEIARLMRNVYYDTAASLYLYRDDIFPLAARLASGKVLFATDYPLLRPSTFVQRMRAARVPEVSLRRMLGGNAWRVLKLGERS